LDKDFVIIGKIISTQGNRGEVKVYPLTDSMDRFYNLNQVFITKAKERRLLDVKKVKLRKNFAIIKFADIENIKEAKLLVNYYITINKAEAIKLPEGRYFVFDIIGLEVYTEDDKLLGKVIDIIFTGSNDVYIVKSEDKKEILIPAIYDVVKKIDLENKKIIIKVIDGLL